MSSEVGTSFWIPKLHLPIYLMKITMYCIVLGIYLKKPVA
jgi:hypothetical protein